MEEKGQNVLVGAPGSSSLTEQHEITTILSGESDFCYGGVVSEGPEVLAEPTTSGGGYDWASREASELRNVFRSRVVLADWVENNCILRTLDYRSCVKLVACREDERVFHGRENATNDFFYYYSPPFYDLYLRLPLTTFQMAVLKTLNVAPTQLHPNSWGYMQAFVVVCQALAIKLTVALFLRFFRCHPVAKRGWIYLILESGDALLELYLQSYRGFKEKFFKVSILESGRTYFFDEDGNPKFPLYWTQDPLKFTLWDEDKMTIEELEALNVLTALPRLFSSRRLINCLDHDDFGSRIMGRKGSVRNWFHAFDTGKSSAGRLGTPSKLVQVPPSVRVVSCDEVGAVEEQLLVRKRKGKMVDATGGVPKKMKETAEETDRPLPKGLWDPSFNLSHKMDFNLDDAEKKVVESMTEQQMADDLLEIATRTTMAAWHMEYASDRGVLRVELEKSRTQLKEIADAHAACEQRQRESEQRLREGQTLLNSTWAAGSALKNERDELRLAHDQMASELVQLERLLRGKRRNARSDNGRAYERLQEGVEVAHLLQVSTEGVAFDVRKDVYEGQMLPLVEVPENAFLEVEDGVEDATVATEGPHEVATEEKPSVGAAEEAVTGSPNILID
ncbi:hypothetical protein LR48_Vigan10g131900 [Vigna angularis]|uniref:Transposase (putative) gypsy type domain-containing protein n=1 Tax=Phaseolus angularis TaxID=3914 RepID=A0A0L9VKI4_PHAAN|nr:hypothetical protein LR48_Vigan10g131900 [Vigna angularis]